MYNKMEDKYSKENIQKIINESKSIKECLVKLGRPTSGDNYNFLKRKIKKYNLDFSHFLSRKELRQEALKARNNKPFALKFSFDEIFTKDSKYVGSGNTIKNKLYNLGLKKRECEECGLGEEWKGKKLSLHLDHINGDNRDNRLDNLRILCPNCHSVTDTYGGKNRKSTKL